MKNQLLFFFTILLKITIAISMEKFLNQAIIPRGSKLAIMILAHEQSRDGSVQ